MKIAFVETEDDEQSFFAEHLASHDVHFVDALEEVPAGTEIVSVFVNSRVNDGFFRKHPSVRLVTTRSSSVDHLDARAARRNGVAMARVPDFGAATVAEHTFALILGVARKLRHCLHSGKARGSSQLLRGMELHGKTIGVIGTGRVGMHVLRIARGFAMNAVAYDMAPQHTMARRLDFEYVTLERLLTMSDIVTLHIPLAARTRHLLNARRLSKCRHGVILINTSRGALADIDALIAGLDSGRIGGIGLDVLEDEKAFSLDAAKLLGAEIVQRIHAVVTPGGNPGRREERLNELRGLMRNRKLLAHENVFFTPHVGFNSTEAIGRINMGTVKNIRDFIGGRLHDEVVIQ